jgi:hypothetical protein
VLLFIVPAAKKLKGRCDLMLFAAWTMEGWDADEWGSVAVSKVEDCGEEMMGLDGEDRREGDTQQHYLVPPSAHIQASSLLSLSNLLARTYHSTESSHLHSQSARHVVLENAIQPRACTASRTGIGRFRFRPACRCRRP